ncbi:phosphatase PAP2 family protein [Kitasatospora sp. CM 4170]|uniref:Phosphatase PAP2 family protein n=1 Tax=Kitasatospora aburaviensis TaxID=67265 RepID=A0ABW1EQH6_9ACTN|nr:phosphatase PAP2 family protein [Kitasatospora sp. CM 4170]WNM48771.1 phosphatase PAP2 family protein [Kitasatospora sp. CM 4170]
MQAPSELPENGTTRRERVRRTPAQPGRDACREPGRDAGWPPLSRRHAGLLALTCLGYLLVVAGVLLDTALVDLDWSLRLLHPRERWPGLRPLLDNWVVAGQRGPSAIAALAWLGWRAHRLRRLRPLLVMGAALLLLNVTVGAVKIVTGRLGPHYAHYVGSPELFSGGTIFPSGHTANAVVTWGVLAYLAVRWRRTGAVLAAATACSVGLTTVYLGTHWVSDVLAGWTAGLLVLLALPLLEPLVTAAEQRVAARRARRAAPAVIPPRSVPRPRRAPRG